MKYRLALSVGEGPRREHHVFAAIDRAVDRRRPAVVRVRLEGEDAGPFGEHPSREQAVETDVSPSLHHDAVWP
jgi:hypothetical protein